MANYNEYEIGSIYELGRMYFEMGFFAAAERVFSGLAAIDDGKSPARLGLGLVKLERGLYQEAVQHLRDSLQSNQYSVQTKVALSFAFLGLGELSRARSILSQMIKEIGPQTAVESEVRTLWEALAVRLEL